MFLKDFFLLLHFRFTSLSFGAVVCVYGVFLLVRTLGVVVTVDMLVVDYGNCDSDF